MIFQRFFRFYASSVALSAVLGATHPALAQPTLAQEAPDGIRLFLLIGQSNMAGRGKIEPQDEVTNPRIWMLTKDLGWVLAKDPLHFDKPVAGVGLASEFARTLAKNDPNISIGLIPCAVGGTTLDQWKPGGALYKAAIARTREAMKKGTLAGILWHQGESDTGGAKADKLVTYPTHFVEMIAQLRQDLDAPDVPLVIGELGHFRPEHDPFNGMLPDLAAQVPHCALVSSEGLDDRGDKLHFNSPSLRIFGQRYAGAYLKLQAQPATQAKQAERPTNP